MQRASIVAVLTVVAGCYYSPEVRRDKADPNFMSEADAVQLITKKLQVYGFRPVLNMKLTVEGAMFEADGFDQNMRIGFEYRSHEDGDFEAEEDQRPEGLTNAEIEALDERGEQFREYFLVVTEAPRGEIEVAVDKFVEKLFEKEVLKKVKPKEEAKEALFPEADKEKEKELLPWESTGDLKKKRQEMEDREQDGKAGTDSGGAKSDEGDVFGGDKDRAADDATSKKPEDSDSGKKHDDDKKEDEAKNEDF